MSKSTELITYYYKTTKALAHDCFEVIIKAFSNTN